MFSMTHFGGHFGNSMLHCLPDVDYGLELNHPKDAPLYQSADTDLFRTQLWSTTDPKPLDVIVKVFRSTRAKELNVALLKCSSTLFSLDHENIVPTYGFEVGLYEVHATVTPHFPRGNIVKYLADKPDVDRLQLVTDVAKGLTYMHEQDIVHGSVHTRNVLIDSRGQALLDDAIVGHLRRTFGGNEGGGSALGGFLWDYLRPQGKVGPQASKARDIFDFATLACEVCLSGMSPRSAHHQGVDYAPLWAILQPCWVSDPHERPPMASVMADLQDIADALRTGTS